MEFSFIYIYAYRILLINGWLGAKTVFIKIETLTHRMYYNITSQGSLLTSGNLVPWPDCSIYLLFPVLGSFGVFLMSLFYSLHFISGLPVVQTEGGSDISNCGPTHLNMPCSQIRKKKSGGEESKKAKVKQTKTHLKSAAVCIQRTGLA